MGAALLLLARGLQRRLDAAWLFTAVLLGAGACAYAEMHVTAVISQ